MSKNSEIELLAWRADKAFKLHLLMTNGDPTMWFFIPKFVQELRRLESVEQEYKSTWEMLLQAGEKYEKIESERDELLTLLKAALPCIVGMGLKEQIKSAIAAVEGKE